MPYYLAVNVSRKPRILKKFTSASAAQKWRTKQYKRKGYRRKIALLGPRGILSPRTYGRR